MYVWIDPEAWSENGFGPMKSDQEDYTMSNYEVWSAQCSWGFTDARTDRGGEYTSTKFEAWCKEKGITHSLTAPNSSCGPAETKIRTIKRLARSYLNTSCGFEDGAGDFLWDEACAYANDVTLMMPSRVPHLEGRSPWEQRHFEPPPLKRLHAWGCLAFVNKPQAKTFENKGRKAIFIGLARHQDDGFRFYDPQTRTVFHGKTATFLEDVFPLGADKALPISRTSRKGSTPFDDNDCYNPLCKGNEAGVHHSSCSANASSAQDVAWNEEEKGNEAMEQAGPGRNRSQTQVFDPSAWDAAYKHDQEQQELQEQANTTITGSSKPKHTQRYNKNGRMMSGLVPNDYNEAISSEDRASWITAIESEKHSIKTQGTFEKILRAHVPRGRKTIKARWVFAIKRNSDGSFDRFKARLVAKGYLQRLGEDYTETYAPTPSLTSVRTVLALGLQLGFSTEQIDVATAFLYPDLPKDEQIFMEAPPGLEMDDKYCLELKKTLYGLRQASYMWNKHLDTTLRSHNFKPLDADRCIYTHRDRGGEIDCIAAVHTDDGAIIGKKDIVEKAKAMLASHYTIKDFGKIKSYLGMTVNYADNGQTLDLSQEGLARAILNEYNMTDCNPSMVPARSKPLMPPDEEMSEEESNYMLDKPFRNLIGSLQYLSLGTRPDLSYAVGWLSRHVACPRRVHWQMAMQVLRYLKGTVTFGIRYKFDGNVQPAIGWSDSNWGGEEGSDRKSTTGYVFIFAGGANIWRSVKQTTVARSSAVAEIVALDEAVKTALWLRKLHKGLDIGNGAPIKIHEDNAAAIAISTKNRRTKRTRHIDIKYFAINDDVEKKRIEVAPVASADNIADIFTKGLERQKFLYFREMLGLVDTAK